jgi:hypothetical protein
VEGDELLNRSGDKSLKKAEGAQEDIRRKLLLVCGSSSKELSRIKNVALVIENLSAE